MEQQIIRHFSFLSSLLWRESKKEWVPRFCNFSFLFLSIPNKRKPASLLSFSLLYFSLSYLSSTKQTINLIYFLLFSFLTPLSLSLSSHSHASLSVSLLRILFTISAIHSSFISLTFFYFSSKIIYYMSTLISIHNSNLISIPDDEEGF